MTVPETVPRTRWPPHRGSGEHCQLPCQTQGSGRPSSSPGKGAAGVRCSLHGLYSYRPGGGVMPSDLRHPTSDRSSLGDAPMRPRPAPSRLQPARPPDCRCPIPPARYTRTSPSRPSTAPSASPAGPPPSAPVLVDQPAQGAGHHRRRLRRHQPGRLRGRPPRPPRTRRRTPRPGQPVARAILRHPDRALQGQRKR